MFRAVAHAFAGEGALTERQGAVLVAGAGVAFSFTAIAYAGVEGATDFQFLTYRGLSTALAMLLLIVVRRGRRPVSFAGITRTTWAASVVLAATSMLYILALAGTTAATTLSLLAASPVFAAVFGWLFLREKVARSTYVAIGLTATGVGITVGASLSVGSGFGLLFAAIIPVAVGCYSVLMRSMTTIDPVVPALIASVMLTVGAGAAALVGDGGIGISARDVAMASISGGMSLGIGLPMFNLGHRSVAAARIPLLLMTEVVLAPLWVWIWPGETPGIATLFGGAVILTSVVWLVRQTEPDAEPLLSPVG